MGQSSPDTICIVRGRGSLLPEDRMLSGGTPAILNNDVGIQPELRFCLPPPDFVRSFNQLSHGLQTLRISCSVTFVLSALHTNSAAATVTRLREMGVEDYLLAATLKGVLVRRLCPDCKDCRAGADCPRGALRARPARTRCEPADALSCRGLRRMSRDRLPRASRNRRAALAEPGNRSADV